MTGCSEGRPIIPTSLKCCCSVVPQIQSQSIRRPACAIYSFLCFVCISLHRGMLLILPACPACCFMLIVCVNVVVQCCSWLCTRPLDLMASLAELSECVQISWQVCLQIFSTRHCSCLWSLHVSKSPPSFPSPRSPKHPKHNDCPVALFEMISQIIHHLPP